MSGRGVLDVASLKARCSVDPRTHCWLWQRAVDDRGHPRIHTIDYARQTKRVQSGPRAAWQIAHQAELEPWALVFRACGVRLCLNPAHLRLANCKRDISAHHQRAGFLCGRGDPADNLAAARKGWAAQGRAETPEAVVREIRAAPQTVTGRALAWKFALHEQTVSRIRRGESHKWVTP